MTDKWVIDPNTGQGKAVPMTAAEQAEFDALQSAAATQTAAQQQAAQTAQTITDNLNGRMVKIRQARTALANGNLFAAMSANEKAALDGLLEDDLYLIRLALHQYDAVA